jgi:hypothetical protein
MALFAQGPHDRVEQEVAELRILEIVGVTE